MIKHIVMFKFANEAEGKTKAENLAIAKEGFEALSGKVPSIRSLRVELNSPEADQSNYDLVLITEHDDIEGLNAYQNHPEHKKIGAFVGKVRELRACVDYEF